MKALSIIALLALMPGCADAQSPTTETNLDITGDSLPAIRHVTEMKISGDTLLFAYESNDGYGQRFLRRAVIDFVSNQLKSSPDVGKRDDGYYVSFMPYPVISDNGKIRVISQDDGEIYSIENDTSLVRTKHYLMDGNSTVPFPMSRYVKDIFMSDSDQYVFMGREPNGGRQFAMAADLTSSKIDTIRQINISPELQTWMPNTGEMAYSHKHRRLAFAYRLHPVIEIFRLDGSVLTSVEVAKPTFNPATLDEADFEDMNPLHFVDITTTDDYIYALYWGHTSRQHQAHDAKSTIYKVDWDGNIVARYPVNSVLKGIAAYNDNILIGWTGNNFVKIPAGRDAIYRVRIEKG